jgi:DNA-binding response OmpR family regulator
MLTEAILLEQNKRLRERNEELEETVRQLQSSITSTPLPLGLSHTTPLEGKVLRALMKRPQLATKEFIYRAIYPLEDHVDIKIIDVAICGLRKKMTRTGRKIETVWGQGYRLVNDTLTTPVRAGVSDASETLAA